MRIHTYVPRFLFMRIKFLSKICWFDSSCSYVQFLVYSRLDLETTSYWTFFRLLRFVRFTLIHILILSFRNSFCAITALWLGKYLIRNINSVQTLGNLRLGRDITRPSNLRTDIVLIGYHRSNIPFSCHVNFFILCIQAKTEIIEW